MRKIFIVFSIVIVLLSVPEVMAQVTFSTLNGIPGGETTEIHKDQNGKLYTVVRNVGQIYSSEDQGNTWDLFDVGTTGVYAFYIDGPDLYYFTYSEMFKSTDNGASWTRVNSGFSTFININKAHKSPVSATTWIVEGPCEGVFISTDDGVNWTNIVTETCNSGSDGNYRLEINSAGDIYYINERQGIFRHKFPADGVWDNSKVEKIFDEQSPWDSDTDMNLFISVSDKVIVAYHDALATYKLGISSSGDTGTFTDLALPVYQHFAGSFNKSFNGNLVVVSHYANEVFELTDELTPTWVSGAHPTNLYGEGTIERLFWFSATEVYACSPTLGIFRSLDGGTSWQMANGSGNKSLNFGTSVDIEYMNNGNIVVLPNAFPKGVWVSTDQGNSFSFNPFGATSESTFSRFNGNGLFKLQDNSIIMHGNGSLKRSENGITWTDFSTDYAPLFLPIGSSDVYFINDNSSKVRKTTLADISDGGPEVTLTEIEANLPTSSYVYSVIEHQNDFYIDMENYDANQRELWKVETAVTPFTSQKLLLPIPLDGTPGMVTIDNKLYVSSSEGEVAYSTNQGVTWTVINYSQHDQLLAIDQEGGGIGLSTRGGLAITQDDGKTWSTYATFSPNGIIQSLTKDGNGNFLAAMSAGPVSKFEGTLILNNADLPTPVNISWEPLSGPYGGGTNGLTKDSQGNIYTFQRYGTMFKLPVGSNTWERVKPGTSENRMVYVADNDDLYSISWDQIAKSTDSGATWSIISEGQTREMVNIVVANNGNIITSSTGGGEGIYVSTDNGANFTTPLGSGPKGDFWDLVKSGSGNLWTYQINGQHKLYNSADNGLTWSVVNTIDLTNKRVLSISALDGNAVAVVTEDDIGLTTDDGLTWTSIKGSINLTEYYQTYPGLSRVYLTPDNNYFFYNLNDVYTSTDKGSSWTQSQVLSNEGTALSDFIWRGNDIIASSTQAIGIRRSVNGNSNWETFASGLTAFFGSEGEVFANGNKLFTYSGGGGDYFETSDDGLTFTNDGTVGYYDGIMKDPSGEKLVRFGSGVSYSTNNGESWTNDAGDEFFERVTTIDGSVYFTFYRDYSNNGVGVFARSTDLVNWIEINAEGYPLDDTGPNYFRALNNDILFSLGYNGVTNRQELYRISFGVAELITDTKAAGEIMEYHDGKILLYRADGKLSSTTDGINWTQSSAPPAPLASNFHVSENGFYFIHDMEAARLWISKDEGANWQFIDGFLYEAVFDVEVNPNNGYAYAVVKGEVMYKSNIQILDDDGVNPAFVAGNSFSPNNGSLNLNVILPSLSIEFDERVKAVAGKLIRLFDSANPTSPIREFEATSGVISTDGRTVQFNYNATLDYSTQYFVTMEAGSFTDIFGNPGPGILSSTDWTFTTQAAPDNTPPTISVTTSNLNYIKGAPKVFELNVTDNIEVDALGGKIYYRKISDPASTSFNNADLTASGNDAPSLNFSVSSLESWFDAIGLEFYFEVVDKAGNMSRLPSADDSYFYSYIDYFSEKPQIEGLGRGSTKSAYRIMAVPFDLGQANTISGQFSQFGEADDPTIKEKFRIGIWNNTKGEFDEYPESLTTIGRGRGYWFIMKEFTDIELSNASAPENNRDDFFKMNLQDGWNQIGNPYPVPISWDEVRAQDPNIGVLKTYSNGTFADGDILQPYQGGFVKANGGVDNLIIRFAGITTGGRIAEENSNLGAEDWRTRLSISQGEFTNAIGGFGMAPEATDGKDHLDDFNPPTITHRLELIFDNTDEAALAKSIVKTDLNHSWSFTAYAGGTDMVSLKWDNSKFGDNNIGLWLYDEERVAFVDMRANAEYKYLTTPEKKFKIYYGDLPEMDLELTSSLLGEPWPNPSSGKMQIPFAITKEHGRAEVVINIFDAQGRLVKELTNQTFDPGAHQMEWLPNRAAHPLGLHLIQWNMITENGDQIQETKRVLVK